MDLVLLIELLSGVDGLVEEYFREAICQLMGNGRTVTECSNEPLPQTRCGCGYWQGDPEARFP